MQTSKQISKIYKHQAGTTTLGIIVGVVLGLVVALGISLYLAYSSAPIQVKPSASQTKIEAPKEGAKIPDPNEALYKKPPEEKPAVAEVPAGTVPPAAVPPVTAAQKPKADDAIGAIAKAASTKVATTSAVTPAVAVAPPAASKSTPVPAPAADTVLAITGERYFVQAGAFKSLPDAETLRAKVAMAGVEMRVSARDSDSGAIHRVRTNPLAAAEAEKTRKRLSDNGIEASLVKVQ